MSQAKQYTVEELLGGLKSSSKTESRNEAEKLIAAAKSEGMNLRDYFRYSIDKRGKFVENVPEAILKEANGYELALMYMGLPVKDDLDAGILLRAADDAFKSSVGARALFPYVTDDVLQWRHRFRNLSTIDQIVSQTRTISGSNELVTTVVLDADENYRLASISEGGRIPIEEIKSTDQAVKFYKHGMGYRWSYEFERRAAIELILPYLARAQRKMENSKVAACTNLLINGDGTHSAAPEYNQQTDAGVSTGGLQYRGLLQWFADMSKNGLMIDTALMSVDTYIEWVLLFTPTLGNRSQAEAIAEKTGLDLGTSVTGIWNLVKPVISEAVPSRTIIGFNKAETAEELKEAGSEIEESERAIANQMVTVVRTNNSGFRLVFGDTRSMYTYKAA